jgi:hypothetical protein
MNIRGGGAYTECPVKMIDVKGMGEEEKQLNKRLEKV